ncbi:MAG: putative glycogen debranching enzyme, archaeal type, TIGR01561 [Candidatus Jettenia ecosi]|uniref:Putative glycogen debranching enzyme, archaeal type, TIGR01561 n=1 Tax=Candidatus Jettenia ecosi TaxID=2494326 RepID=A0A533QFQ1_9BACT|nr:MAG: putative glycogen debranching enzyme, archaeal type, TIGR01561 [Candidatus Jettenia ecosi]
MDILKDGDRSKESGRTIIFNRDICHDLSLSAEKEWLETNGIGGYASSTIIGANTRRYHGLLMAATRPPLGRSLLLSKVEETLSIGEKQFPLSTNFYPNAIHPEGYKNLIQFSLHPFPTFAYSVSGVDIKKIVFMVHGENTTIILYQVTGRGAQPLAPLSLKIRIMIAFRDYHWLTSENPSLKTKYHILPHGIYLQPYEQLPPLYLFHNAQSIDTVQFWYKNMEYPKELERGLDAHEDHFSPFALQFDLNKGIDSYIVASTNACERWDILELLNTEINRRKGLYRKKCDDNGNADLLISSDFPLKKNDIDYFSFRKKEINRTCEKNGVEKTKDITKENLATLIESLLNVSDSFIVKREGDKKSIIAGYHWFGDWGRDTMISLPGLTLVQGRFEDARKILLSYARYVSKGMIPNRFPDYGETPEYNTVDASLWYIHAVYQYLRFTKDFNTVRRDLYKVLKEIIEYYKKGTRYHIHMDTDGLIDAGAEGVQLTWMDAKVGDWVVTPRMGKAAEINALWYNALQIMVFLAREMNLPDESTDYSILAQKVCESFNKLFWFEEGQYLYDFIEGETGNKAIRPNQIFAVSLPHSMLTMRRQKRVIEIVQEHLLTPYGLRTLSPKDKDYMGHCVGGAYERDKAYHQGTVWPWLIGPYISAYARVYADHKNTQKYIEGLFEPFYTHLFESGLGTISEIFDGDPPHTPRGCISQAWSVAELLRTYFEHVYGLENN